MFDACALNEQIKSSKLPVGELTQSIGGSEKRGEKNVGVCGNSKCDENLFLHV